MTEGRDPAGFDSAYQGTPPWDIGRPQREFVALAEAGSITGSVLDVGCGTGENALFLAEGGLEVVGVDGSPTAIRRARAKAEERRTPVTFVVGDALKLESLGRSFDTIIDCGLFHVFSDEERVGFEKSLRRALRSGGRYFMMCFSEQEPGDHGPRRVTQDEIRRTFAAGWTVEEIRPATFETLLPSGDVKAWLASFTRP